MTLLLDMPGGFEAFLAAGFFVIFIVFAGALTAFIFYLLTLQKTLLAISPENRKMPPTNVWLLLIPVFNWVWNFIVIANIADSIKAECIRLNIPAKEARPTYGVGLAYSICSVLFFIPFAPLASLVLWIVYWVQVNNYKNLIIANKDNFQLDIEKQHLSTATV